MCVCVCMIGREDPSPGASNCMRSHFEKYAFRAVSHTEEATVLYSQLDI